MNINAVIFDFDGTLVDSEENYYLADKKLLLKYGIKFTQAMKREFIGTGNYEMMKKIRLKYGIDKSAEELTQEKNDIYLKIALNNTKVYPKMLDFLKGVIELKYKVAVASGSSPNILKELLSSTELAKYFEIVVSSEDAPKGKPAPDIFLEAAKRLKVDPSKCCAVEDSKYGVISAKSAGMLCISVPYLTTQPLDPNFEKSDLLFRKGMKEFDPEKALFWLKNYPISP
ncbi:MAG TPA: HAD family phosphatase [Spirochaetota bacterium]|jgi:HAD superfamily hydrolase (TIGR01509 family)|nr:MAG: Fructose-1-phosphate phosphatase YqaB [Spirochaetes bacterium ADurb.Bin133]HNZ25692.1 HAD family phosphatase [Spirochaetota bacterium]HPY86656.1 HAD family phosphatase [Spirochaetota bacterium]HQB61298.1 HAD family phosphatase [Spirochaetota bacterium]